MVCGEALKDALRKGAVSGAALDVWEHEPDIDRDLMSLLEFATPHIAGYSADGKANGTAACVRNIANFFGLDAAENWYPKVPDPVNGAVPADSLFSAVTAAYDIRNDDRRLRESPGNFEKLRGSYPLRREFPAFLVKKEGRNNTILPILKQLNFQLEE